MKASNSTDDIPPVVLGKAYDTEGDSIVQSLTCLTCTDEQAELFVYDEEEGRLTISPLLEYGAYYFRVSLSDDNIEDP